ncbi:MAG: biotin--[acetyl-CoA-carboxylase] ligase [Heliobacteriaceae bacterium]|jgi:biotin-[acetyl-CoA-carboxylase] ligase BirA-like protein|nr:biotin--[acetyl-CoA-carboxylase] ligase [Heliobacteriaceae bacterium]
MILLEEIDSTNLYAKRNIDDLAHGTVIRAKRQTGGRGQFERKWVDLGSGNLFASIVLKNVKMSGGLTLAVARAICSVLEEYGLQPQIKPPNDVLINGKKAAGILCESATQGQNLKWVIIGIGVNLHAHKEDLAQIDRPSTALNLEGVDVQPDEFLENFMSQLYNLEKLYENSSNGFR